VHKNVTSPIERMGNECKRIGEDPCDAPVGAKVAHLQAAVFEVTGGCSSWHIVGHIQNVCDPMSFDGVGVCRCGAPSQIYSTVEVGYLPNVTPLKRGLKLTVARFGPQNALRLSMAFAERHICWLGELDDGELDARVIAIGARNDAQFDPWSHGRCGDLHGNAREENASKEARNNQDYPGRQRRRCRDEKEK
jgi:hypothetical protein